MKHIKYIIIGMNIILYKELFKIKVWELREQLEIYDGEMEVIISDEERNVYDFEGIEIDIREREPKLAIKYY